MGLPTSNTNTPGMLMQARKVYSVCVYVSCMCGKSVLCVCTGARLIPSASWPRTYTYTHAHTRTHPPTHRWAAFQQAISMVDTPRICARARAGQGSRALRNSFGSLKLFWMHVSIKLHYVTRTWQETWQPNFWISNILSLCHNRFISSSALFLQCHYLSLSLVSLLQPYSCCQDLSNDTKGWAMTHISNYRSESFWWSHALHHVPAMLCFNIQQTHPNIADNCKESLLYPH